MTVRIRRNFTKTNGTWALAIAMSFTAPSGPYDHKLLSVSLKFSTAPTTSQNFTITLNANAGEAYDTLLYSVDPSATSIASLLWQPDTELILEAGDAIDVAYTNTDTRTYGVQITTEEVA